MLLLKCFISCLFIIVANLYRAHHCSLYKVNSQSNWNKLCCLVLRLFWSAHSAAKYSYGTVHRLLCFKNLYSR